jgi:hypothetical protein
MNQNCNRCIRFKVLPIYQLDNPQGGGGGRHRTWQRFAEFS